MNKQNHSAVTLLELMISLTILGLLVIGLSSIDTFSHRELKVSDNRSKLQNEISYVLEHMAKNINKAIGDINDVPVALEDSNKRVKVYIDANKDGLRNDYNIAYQYNSTNYEVWYYPIYTGGADSYEIITNRISTFEPTYSSSNNYVQVNATVCWDPDGTPDDCGTQNNPQVTMVNRIEMPAVSTH